MTHDDDHRQKRESALHILRVAQQAAASVPTATDLTDAVTRMTEQTSGAVTIASLESFRNGVTRRASGFAIVRAQTEATDADVVQTFPPRKGE